MILGWREPLFTDDIEILNTDDVLSVNLKIEMENAMKPNFHLKFYVFQTLGILKSFVPLSKMTFFLRKSKSKGETIWQ